MGHYDAERYLDETSKVKITDKMIKSLEIKLIGKKSLIVYDDYSGMLNLLIAKKSKILSYRKVAPTSWKIFKKIHKPLKKLK